MSAWASNAHTKQGFKGLEWHKPMHERERLLQLIKISPTNNNSNQATALTKVAAIQHLYQLITQAADTGGVMLKNPQLFVPSIQEDCVLNTFHFSSSMIDSLKRRAYGLNNLYSSSMCSSFEIVAAHLWKVSVRSLI